MALHCLHLADGEDPLTARTSMPPLHAANGNQLDLLLGCCMFVAPEQIPTSTRWMDHAPWPGIAWRPRLCLIHKADTHALVLVIS